MKLDDKPDYSVRAVHRVCDILDLLRLSPKGVSQTEVAQASGLPKSSALRYLASLEARKYVERDATSGQYRAGQVFGSPASVKLEALRQRALPLMEKLRDEFEETVNLGALDGDHVRYLQIVESQRGVRLAARYDELEPLHSTALGKVIATTLSEGHVRSILARAGMPAVTVNTITSAEDYFDEVSRVREQGFGMDEGENELDGRCVAVLLEGFPLPAALSVSAPAERFPPDRVERAIGSLREAADWIAHKSPEDY